MASSQAPCSVPPGLLALGRVTGHTHIGGLECEGAVAAGDGAIVGDPDVGLSLAPDHGDAADGEAQLCQMSRSASWGCAPIEGEGTFVDPVHIPLDGMHPQLVIWPLRMRPWGLDSSQ